MKPTYKTIHPKCKINGKQYTLEQTKQIACNLIKEGEPYQQDIGEFLLDWVNDKPYITIKTSGTTGIPKTISLSKQHMVNSALATRKFFDLDSGDTALNCLPVQFIAGKMMFIRAFVLGLKLHVVKPSSNPLQNTNKTYDFAAMVPFQVENVLEKLHHVKKLIVGGAPVSAKLKSQLQNISTQVFETYGMTETCTHIAIKKLNYFNSDKEKQENYFKTLSNVSITKDDRNCLLINAPEILDETIITNDLVNIISENQFEWLGRYDNIINSGGIKLIPEQVESKLQQVLKNRFFITGIDDEKLGKKLVLVVEGDASQRENIEIAIKNLQTLSKFEIPKEIHFLDRFEETSSGKVIRKLSFINI